MATNTKKIRPWLPGDINQLWSGEIKDVAKKLGRSVHSVSVARAHYKRFKPGNPEGLVATLDNISNRKKAEKSEKATPVKKRGSYKPRGLKTVAMNTKDIVREVPNQNGAFKMTFNDQKLEFQTTPKAIRLSNDSLEVDF